MRRSLLTVLAFLGGAVAGYVLSFATYIVVTSMGGVFDREGAFAMGVAFTIGPIVALACGLVAAIVVARRSR